MESHHTVMLVDISGWTLDCKKLGLDQSGGPGQPEDRPTHRHPQSHAANMAKKQRLEESVKK